MSNISMVIELIAGLSFIFSALFLSNITGGVIGIPASTNGAFGYGFLCIAIAAVFLFVWVKWRKI